MLNKSITIKILPLLLILLVTGCSNSIKVSGKVTFSDGSPLDTGNVIFENEYHSFRGKIQKDGTFRLGRLKDGDGIIAGKYQVAIVGALTQNSSENHRKVVSTTYLVAEKFRLPKTSGIEYDIQKKTTDISIIVEHPKTGEENIKAPPLEKLLKKKRKK
jgi:major membrane immunogen (membrane-anchored lipoprotein)